MNHEIAAAFIVGGFIVAYQPNSTSKWDFTRGVAIVLLALSYVVSHP